MNTLSTKPTEPVGPLGSAEKNKQWQRELLMERLRSRSNQHKTFQELSKSMRMSMLEKRYALDAVEKSNLQKCLDSMQHCIKVTTRQGLIERLESLSRQLGLKFMEDTSGLFISSDMFYLEIILDHSGTLSDVKVHHECKIEQQSCSELVTCLLKGDFSDFTVQLEGLSSIYQLNAEPKVKSKAFIALQAMETDIYNLFSIQTFHKDAQLLLVESSVGVVQKRRGGHPMKLTYFVSPYDLLSFETKCIAPLTIDLLTTKNIGMSVTLNLEASSANKIQILPTVTFNQDSQGSSIPIYSPLTSTNSTLLPATFVLRLNKSLPVCESLRQSIVHSSENLFSDSKPTSIMQLIVQTASEGQILNSSKGLFVSLPDQNHCYFFTESKQMKGFIVTNLPFTEPSQVPKILSILRRQARFYTLLASCVRPQGKMMDLDTTTMLEVNATSIYQISVALQHPFEESMATVEFDLNDPINVICRLYSLTNNFDAISAKLSKIAQKSLSIPVTIRALLKLWEQERMKVFHRGIENGNFNLPLGPTDPGVRGSEIRDMKVKSERGINGSFNNSSRQFFHPSGVIMSGTDTFSENNVNMFAGSNENVMMNQFAMKTNNDLNFTDIGAIKNYSTGEDFCRSPKSNIDLNCQNFSETSDSSSLGTSTPSSDSGVAASSFQKTFQTNTNDSLCMNNEAEYSANKILKNFHVAENNKNNLEIWKDSIDDENPSQVQANNTHSGIVDGETNSTLSVMRLDRRPAIEIIPITTASQNESTSSSVTLHSNKNDKKSLIKKSEDKSKIDKKRKRKKEDSPMGPPEKLISKQDSLNRQLNSSVKNYEISPTSPSCLARKYSLSSSPKLNQSNSSKHSPKNSPVYNSPKHLMNSLNSPKSQYGITSPKHGVSGSTGKPSMSALKSATNSLSPKSEKGKMSYRDKEKDRSSKSANSSKIKTSTVKLKQIDLSAAFLTHGENSYNDLCLSQNSNEVFKTTSPTGSSNIGINSNVNNPCKVRKGSLSAVIDKLKSAQNSGDDFLYNTLPSAQKSSDSDGGFSVTNALNEKSESLYGAKAQLSSGNSSLKTNTSSCNLNVNSEYQIKPSLDGMKITINKTRSKDGSSQKTTSPPASKAQASGNNSPKKISSLKTGGASSTATKKYSNKTNSQGQTTQGKGNFQKSNSSGNLAPSKSSLSGSFTKSLSSNSFSATDLLKKDKISKAKSAHLDRPPSNSKHDPTDVMKILRYASPKSAMEGFMKSLNTKFQIPKLSARTANDDSKKDNRSNNSSAPTTPLDPLIQSPPIGGNNCNTESAGKSLPENLSKNKYPFSLGKSTSESVQSNIPNTFGKISNYISPNTGFLKDLNPLPKSSSSDTLLNTVHQKNQIIKPLSTSTPSTPMNMTFSPFTSPHNSVLNSASASRSLSQDTSNFQNQSADVSMRPPSAPCAVDMSKTSELDLSFKSENKLGDIRTVSNVNSIRKVPQHKMSFPPSPSVSLHIVKSPVPSPLMVMPSPHSNSPCITDDELMDEALVGITGK